MMEKTPFEKMFGELTGLVLGKKVIDIKPIDNDLCVKITFEDDSYIVIDTMKTGETSMPVLQYYDIFGDPIFLYEESRRD